ncbi:MAG: hypothetical protein AB201_01715 [Parcubacteria bacterium C7867-006]|nr:MAG: hypothetical protein AB201_01715 [Parcubacteria bacterium C7867-006]
MSWKNSHFYNPPVVVEEIPKMILEMARADPPQPTAHGQVMKRIVRAIGWPSISKVGAQASSDAALLVIRADHDVSFQAQCLSKMNELPKGDVKAEDIKNLNDKVRANLGLVRK